MAWSNPKTNWTADDRMNFEDYNRIKNNILYVWDSAKDIWGNFEIQDMGDDITSEEGSWQAKYFNTFESNVDIINQNMLTQDYGIRQTFYENGPFIQYWELNRLERAILGMKRIADGKEAGQVRLSFRLGAPKGLKL